MKFSKIKIYLFAFVLSFLVVPQFASAATFYVSPNAADDGGSGSELSPKKYISSAISLLSSGDTLILEDGIYQGDNLFGGTVSNMIAPNDYHGRKFPPSGIDLAHPTTIRARNVGQAIIDGQYLSTPFNNGNGNVVQFLHIDGIHFRRGAGANDPVGGGVFALQGSYSKVTNCGFEDGGPVSDSGQWPIAYIAGGSDHVLFEDNWAWGRGRYGIYFQSTGGGVTNSIIRRCVIRQDSNGQGPTAGIMFYNSRGNSVQNSIVLNSEVFQSGSDTYSAFSMTTNDGLGVNNDNVIGSIGLNNNYAGYFTQSSIAGDSVALTDSVLWGNGAASFAPHNGVQLSTSDEGVVTADHVTSGANFGSGFRSNTNYIGILNVLNSISVNNGGYGLEAIDSANFVNTFNNVSGASASSTITNPILSNPIGTSLKHLPRIEEGSTLSGAASDGGDIGANILYQIGGNGTFYGDNGWNDISSGELWPLSNERLWTDKMQAYSASGSGGDRGFASSQEIVLSGLTVDVGASQNPLTDYIWNYLGFPMTVSEIYSSNDTTPPAGPSGLGVM